MKDGSFPTVARAIEAIRQGEMVILVDDERRENEGDLVMAAELVTKEAINFMATHARGLICLSLTTERVEQLGLPMMVEANGADRGTAFTVSVEARYGVTTGISAADRAHTVRTAVDPEAGPNALVRPGHVFPLRARPGGVLQRTGHTEGSVDLARLAKLQPAGVICEIMKEDGTMARYPDLEVFASKHGMMILSIADLIQYRMHTERLVERLEEHELTLSSGRTWQSYVYGVPDGRQFVALTLGVVNREPTIVRVHTGNVYGDVFGVRSERRMAMDQVVQCIEAEGKGVVLFLPGSTDFRSDLGLTLGRDAAEARVVDEGEVLREYGLGAQVLRDLGVQQIRVLTNRPRRVPSLEGYGLEIIEQMLLRDESQSR
ncbi:MAG: 3,4-dihydroxy-2-butanone-4-phosphate synthase [Myxococcota bacterium]